MAHLTMIYRASALCCIIFVAAQVFQQWVFVEVPLGTVAEARLEALAHPLHVARSWAVLISILLLMLPFAVVSQSINHPVFRMLAFGFFSFFVLLEIAYRAIELFVFQNPANLSTIETFQVFQRVKTALYFPLLVSHGIASALVAASMSFRGIDRWLMIGLGWNTVRLTLRTIGLTADVGWMNWLTGTNYLISILAVFIPMTVWLLLESGNGKDEMAG